MKSTKPIKALRAKKGKPTHVLVTTLNTESKKETKVLSPELTKELNRYEQFRKLKNLTVNKKEMQKYLQNKNKEDKNSPIKEVIQ